MTVQFGVRTEIQYQNNCTQHQPLAEALLTGIEPKLAALGHDEYLLKFNVASKAQLEQRQLTEVDPDDALFLGVLSHQNRDLAFGLISSTPDDLSSLLNQVGKKMFQEKLLTSVKGFLDELKKYSSEPYLYHLGSSFRVLFARDEKEIDPTTYSTEPGFSVQIHGTNPPMGDQETGTP